MSVNRYSPHVIVLPEDDLNSELAKGFALVLGNHRSIQVLPPAKGWRKVLRKFNSDHASRMDEFPKRMMVLVIDFDGEPDRLNVALREVPQHLVERVFILGGFSEPERLCSDLGHISCEKIGEMLAQDCHQQTSTFWSHELLKHNQTEIARMRGNLIPILFPA